MAGISTQFDMLGAADGLPAGYIRLAGAASDNVAFINSGYHPNNATRWRFSCVPTLASSNFEVGTNYSTGSRFDWRIAVSGNPCQLKIGAMLSDAILVAPLLAHYSFDVDVPRGAAQMSRNGETIWSLAYALSVSFSENAVIYFPGRQKQASTDVEYVPATWVVTRSEIWESGELVQDLVPVIAPDGVVCFFDLVTRQDFRPANGAFTAVYNI